MKRKFDEQNILNKEKTKDVNGKVIRHHTRMNESFSTTIENEMLTRNE